MTSSQRDRERLVHMHTLMRPLIDSNLTSRAGHDDLAGATALTLRQTSASLQDQTTTARVQLSDYRSPEHKLKWYPALDCGMKSAFNNCYCLLNGSPISTVAPRSPPRPTGQRAGQPHSTLTSLQTGRDRHLLLL